MNGAGKATPGGFAELLRARRNAAALTQRQLAERSGLSLAAIRDLEQGRTLFPRRASVRRLAQSLGISESEFRVFDPELIQDDAETPLRISVLGPLQIWHGPQPAALGGDRQRVILARLALSPNIAVRRGELIDLTWPGSTPSTADDLLNTYLARLRQSVQPGRLGPSVVRSVPGSGYRLDVPAGQLDLLRFRQLNDEALALAGTSPERALQVLGPAHQLWRGDPVADLDVLQEHPLAIGLRDERIASALLFADLADDLGEIGQLLTLLRELSLRYPLHEPVHGRLILALAATGQQAAALQESESLRHRLADEFGIDPSPEFTGYWQRVLRRQWRPAPLTTTPAAAAEVLATRTAPRCLPRSVPRLFGRAAELDEVVETVLLEQAGQTRIVVIDGMAGVGKTAFAVELATLMKAGYPDAHLFVDLQGHSAQAPVAVPEALAQLIGQLGEIGQPIPDDLPGRVALWRSLLADRRCIVLLDNAAGIDQLEFLLPGDSASLVLVTSRIRIGPVDGAGSLSLAPLGLPDAVAMLRDAVGDRVDQEPAAAAAMAELCGRLPLAIRMVAHRLRHRGQWTVRELVDRLRAADPAPIAVAAEGRSVAAAFEVSYRQLTEPEQHLFRLLGLQPATPFEAWAAATLIDRPVAAAREILDSLVEVNLLQAGAPDRYYLHDLLRDFAGSMVGPAERDPATARLLDYYLYTALLAAADLEMSSSHSYLVVPPGAFVRPLTEQRDRVSWLGTEWRTVVALADLAHRIGAHRHACLLPRAIWQFATNEGHSLVMIRLLHQAMASADQLADEDLAAMLHNYVAGNYLRTGDLASCQRHLRRAAELFERVNDVHSLIWIRLNLSKLARETGQLQSSLDQASAAVTMAATAGDLAGEMDALLHRGISASRLGQHDAALADLTRTLAWLYQQPQQRKFLVALDELGRVYLALGQPRVAALLLRRAVRLKHQAGVSGDSAEGLSNLGHALFALGYPEEALRCQLQAQEQIRELGDTYYAPAVANDLGLTLTRLGRVAEAIVAHQSALAVAEQTQQSYEQARAHAGLAAAASRGQLAEAGSEADLAYRMFRSMGLEHAAAQANLTG